MPELAIADDATPREIVTQVHDLMAAQSPERAALVAAYRGTRAAGRVPPRPPAIFPPAPPDADGHLPAHRVPLRGIPEGRPGGALALVTDGGVPEWLTSADIMHAAGITYRRLDLWERAGYLRAARTRRGQQRRPGLRRSWPQRELEVARRMGRLTRAGIPAPLAAAIARSGETRHEIAPGIFIEVTA